MKLRNKKTGGLANILGEQDFFRVYTDAGWADYGSLAELNEDWEDYTPTEPLIKDEKKRTSVKDFFDLLNVDVVVFQNINNCFYHTDHDGITYSIDFEDDGGLKKLDDFRFYTIAELCGEEE